MRKKLSAISTLHYFKLVFRSLLFITALVLYIVYAGTNPQNPFGGFEDNPVILASLCLIFLIEMVLRFFPSKLESMGSQKQFKKNYLGAETKNKPEISKGVFLSAATWILLNGIIAVLYYTNVLDAGILLLIALFYAVCDMICILFFCPFQSWFMKNKCCGSCRIYNWDYAMMFTPLIFIKNIYTLSLVICSVLLLIRWEVAAYLYPERFYEGTNPALSCSNCKEKLCHHKGHLRAFLIKNKHLLKKYSKTSSN